MLDRTLITSSISAFTVVLAAMIFTDTPLLHSSETLVLILASLSPLIYYGATRGAGRIAHFLNRRFQIPDGLGNPMAEERELTMEQALSRAGVSQEYLNEALRQSSFLRTESINLGVVNLMESFCVEMEGILDEPGKLTEKDSPAVYISEPVSAGAGADFSQEVSLFRHFDLLIKVWRNSPNPTPSELLEHYKFWTSISGSRSPEVWESTRKHLCETLVNLVKVSRAHERTRQFVEHWIKLKKNIARMQAIRSKYHTPEFSSFQADYERKMGLHARALNRLSRICAMCSVFRAMLVIKARILSLRGLFDSTLGKRINDVERAILYSDLSALGRFGSHLGNILEQYQRLIQGLNLRSFLEADGYLRKFMNPETEQALTSYIESMRETALADRKLFQTYQSKLEFIRDILELDSIQVPEMDKTISDIRELMTDFTEMNSSMEKSMDLEREVNSILYVLQEPESLASLSEMTDSEISLFKLDDTHFEMESFLESIPEIDQLYNMKSDSPFVQESAPEKDHPKNRTGNKAAMSASQKQASLLNTDI